jgi:Glyoxalase-like domain
MATSVQIVIDCTDPDNLAQFWATALGYKVQDPPTGFATWEEFLRAQGVPESQWNDASAVVDPDGKGPRIYFQRVPENKIVKNRVHLDVNAGGGRSAPAEERRQRVRDEVDRLVAAGATRVEEREKWGDHWVVMQDPEGNEFCVQ